MISCKLRGMCMIPLQKSYRHDHAQGTRISRQVALYQGFVRSAVRSCTAFEAQHDMG